MRLVSVLAITLFVVGCDKPMETKEEIIRPIAWTQAEVFDLSQVRRLSGSLRPVEAADLSFQVGGKVDSVYVNLGDQVSADQPLARLDKTTYDLNVKGARAELQQARATYNEAKNEFERYQELMNKDLVSRSGFDNVKASYESAQSAVDVAETQLDIALKNFSDTLLTSPYQGTIVARTIEPSQQVSAGQTVFQIEGNLGLEVQVLIPENLIQRIAQDSILNVRFPAQKGLSLTAKITEVGVQATSANSFPVTLALQEQSPTLRAGMTAEVDFTFEGEGITGYKGKTIKVPVAALLPGKNRESFVFVFDEEQQKVFKRSVSTVNLINNEVLISQGLEPGEIVATAGVAFLRDGQKVKLLDKQMQQFN